MSPKSEAKNALVRSLRTRLGTEVLGILAEYLLDERASSSSSCDGVCMARDAGLKISAAARALGLLPEGGGK